MVGGGLTHPFCVTPVQEDSSPSLIPECFLFSRKKYFRCAAPAARLASAGVWVFCGTNGFNPVLQVEQFAFGIIVEAGALVA